MTDLDATMKLLDMLMFHGGLIDCKVYEGVDNPDLKVIQIFRLGNPYPDRPRKPVYEWYFKNGKKVKEEEL